MGQIYPVIDERLGRWLTAQPMFVVGTAPLTGDGLINVSPKGTAGTFAVFGPRSVGYLDLTGSGVETIAHLKENGRIVVMFSAFTGRPRIIRLHGRGRPVFSDHPDFAGLRTHFSDHPGVRSIVVIELDRIADSCGYAVPLMDFRADRTVLDSSNGKKGDVGLADYRRAKNSWSLDGLPGLAENELG